LVIERAATARLVSWWVWGNALEIRAVCLQGGHVTDRPVIADVKRVEACCRPTEPADAVCQVRSSHSSAFSPTDSGNGLNSRRGGCWRI